MEQPIPTRQEMFDRAVRGLRSQGWERCITPEVRSPAAGPQAPGGNCVYERRLDDGRVMHCAWGWVDPEGTADPRVKEDHNVKMLADDGIGLAAVLGEHDLWFAKQLQRCHDEPGGGEWMERRFRTLAEECNLTWPEE